MWCFGHIALYVLLGKKIAQPWDSMILSQNLKMKKALRDIGFEIDEKMAQEKIAEILKNASEDKEVLAMEN